LLPPLLYQTVVARQEVLHQLFGELPVLGGEGLHDSLRLGRRSRWARRRRRLSHGDWLLVEANPHDGRLLAGPGAFVLAAWGEKLGDRRDFVVGWGDEDHLLDEALELGLLLLLEYAFDRLAGRVVDLGEDYFLHARRGVEPLGVNLAEAVERLDELKAGNQRLRHAYSDVLLVPEGAHRRRAVLLDCHVAWDASDRAYLRVRPQRRLRDLHPGKRRLLGHGLREDRCLAL